MLFGRLGLAGGDGVATVFFVRIASHFYFFDFLIFIREKCSIVLED